ncbi:transposase [Streptomyces sp. NPDC056178]|uniref:transposase n=1 Tax=Streptomyces sp. NPDC056178 TaxID=3345735 RepID=UPI0035DE0FE4
MDCNRFVTRGDLTDGQWARFETLLPGDKKPGRTPIRIPRQLIDDMRRRTWTGAPWRDVPQYYGLWGRVCDLSRRPQRDGTRAAPSRKLAVRHEETVRIAANSEWL